MKKIVFLLLFFLLFYSRSVGLDWGLPYPMHPDERNMADAVLNLKCNVSSFVLHVSWLKTCFNPNFFAYGQFNIYLGYIFALIIHMLRQGMDFNRFDEVIIALRMISFLSSILNAFVLFKIFTLLNRSLKWFKPDDNQFFILKVACWLIIIFVPYGIQFSHFGTTESLLMLFYSLISYLSLKVLIEKKHNTFDLLKVAIFCGLSIATKVSSISFLLIPIISIILKELYKKSKYRKLTKVLLSKLLFLIASLSGIFLIIAVTIIISAIFSWQSIINWNAFISTIRYEVGVGDGSIPVFYTRSFFLSIPIIFQLIKIFPYALGFSQYFLCIVGFICLSWRKKEYIMLRLFFLIYFIPTSFLYAKWTRFISPIFPITTLIVIIMLVEIYLLAKKYKLSKLLLNFGGIILIFLLIIPGISYASIYLNPDVRFSASKWIYQNITTESSILSETANVIDIPILSSFYDTRNIHYDMMVFNFYDLDQDPSLEASLQQNMARANYIIIPSRRIIYNHTCFEDNFKYPSSILNGYEPARCNELAKKYPKLNQYYQELISGKLGFRQVAKITSYPKISVLGRTIMEFPDESAEETWTVFDHPSVTIYKRYD